MNKEKILLSVIVPVYNVKEYVYQCILSICSQTYGNIQIILVDDGSTDGSSFICDAFSEKDHRITVVHKENGGLVSARRAGLEFAVGEYISFVDGDDWIDENGYEKVIASCHGEFPDIIAYGCIEEYPTYKNQKRNSIKAGLYTGENLKQLKGSILMNENFFEWSVLPHLCDKLIRRELLMECMKDIPDTVSLGEDVVCSFPCMIKAASILSLDIMPYHYRQREGSIVKKQIELEKERFREIYKLLKNSFLPIDTLERQLHYYIFFLLCLKGYTKITDNMMLFPFCSVKPGDRVFVYGAGGFGKVVKNYIDHSDTLILCGWTDKRAEEYIRQGVLLDRLETIFTREYDKVVIAILNENICREICDELVGKGIPRQKIDFVCKEQVDCAELPCWLEVK